MTTTLDERTTATLAKAPVGSLGGQWMTQDAEEELTAAVGLDGWQLYFLGRHGVLGDVDPDVVVAAAYFFPPDHLRSEWTTARRRMTPQDALGHYLRLCHDWGREHLAGFTGVERLADLAQQVVAGADVAGLPLFAGWRAVELPADPPARLAHSLQVLREYHGAVHGVAVVASGMEPLLAVLASQGGEDNARAYGWRPPFPAVTDDDRRRRAEVEQLTDALAAAAYRALPGEERAELVDLLDDAHRHVFG